MKTKFRIARIIVLLGLLVGTSQLTADIGRASDAGTCGVVYAMEVSNCIGAGTCEPGDVNCEQRNAEAAACAGRAESNYYHCLGLPD
jgi:hypothetical protein